MMRLPGGTPRALLVLVAAASAIFLALAWPGAATRGILGEEIQPYLRRYPVVLEWRHGQEGAGTVVPMPPYEPGAPAGPRWVTTLQWPVVAYDGDSRMWPVFIRGHQTAVAAYFAMATGAVLGGGITGARRGTVLLGFAIVLLAAYVAWQNEPRSAPWATAIVAASWGMICIARTAEAFEVGSRTAMMACLALLARRGALGYGRAVAAGLVACIAVLCRGPILTALVPAALVLLLRDGCRPNRRQWAVLAALALVLPVVLVAAFDRLVPFRAGTAALADLPLASIPQRLLGLPHQTVLSLAWLGNAMSVWGPLARGEMSIGPTLWIPAAVAAIPLGFALVRLVRGVAGMGERLFAATFATIVVAGSAMYGVEHQFQLALAVEPIIALAVGEQVVALVYARGSDPWRRSAALGWAVGLLALLVRAHGALQGLLLDQAIQNPMLSGASQRGAVARIRELGLRGPDLVTTVYNQAGVIEGWTDGALRPIHAWPVLSARPSEGDCTLQAAWREVLSRYRPSHVLLTRGANLFESDGMDPPAIERSLRRAAQAASIQLSDDGQFTTEGGGPGWALVRLHYDQAVHVEPGRLRTDPACLEPTVPPGPEPGELAQLDRFESLVRGDRIDTFVVEGIERRTTDPPRTVRIIARRNGTTVAFDVHPDTGDPAPPARGGGYAVFYRNEDKQRVPPDDLVRAAVALAAKLGP